MNKCPYCNIEDDLYLGLKIVVHVWTFDDTDMSLYQCINCKRVWVE
jgi:hypothetical protein